MIGGTGPVGHFLLPTTAQDPSTTPAPDTQLAMHTIAAPWSYVLHYAAH